MSFNLEKITGMLRAKAKFPKVRRKIHRAFYQWYCGIQKELQLECVKHRDNYLVMQMPGLNSVISFVLTAWEINVAVEWQGQCWDLLIAFDAWPKHASEGYYCSLCDEDSRVFYPNRIELWRDHLFKPFLDWVNNELRRHQSLFIHENQQATWASLIQGSDEHDVVILPLWVDR